MDGELKQYNYRLACNEYVFRIPMPWKGRYYAINWDEMLIGRRQWMIGVSLSAATAFHLRMGWGYTFPDVERQLIQMRHTTPAKSLLPS
jgi:hypothetical protein